MERLNIVLFDDEMKDILEDLEEEKGHDYLKNLSNYELEELIIAYIQYLRRKGRKKKVEEIYI
ncbi:MAG: hypothetical protein ACFFCS_01055 [Candidatus Hodarchaeota archaeon]